MNRFMLSVVALSLLAGLVAVGSAQATPKPAEARTYIVTLEAGANAAAEARASGGAVGHVYRHALNGFSATLAPQSVAALSRNPRVLSIVEDQVVTLDAKPCPNPPCGGGGGGGGGQPSQVVPTGIARIGGPKTGTINVDVAVIDTGISSHPDLTIQGGVNCSTGKSYNDGHGHGTHVAGTIGATNDSIGVVGVAPGARLWAVRVLNNAGSGSWASIICGLDWVTANKGIIEVANMSLGGSGSDGGCSSHPLHQAICNTVNAGVTVVVAAGNESDNAANHVPAAYDEVITVSALADFNGAPGGGAAATCRSDVDDTFADFSNYGADVDLIAPGVCILSTWTSGGYNTISGTSMASPHVAGAAALYKAANPGASPGQVKTALQSAGNLNWSNADDPDGIKEKLVSIGS